MLLTIGIKNSSQARASIHNGFWFWKLLVVAGIIVGMGYVMFYHFEDKKDAVEVFGSLDVDWCRYRYKTQIKLFF